MIEGVKSSAPPADPVQVFPVTRWSLVLTAADLSSNEQRGRRALSDLCRVYWQPVFIFLCRKGHSLPEAQDLTQDFFVMILESDWLSRADRERGRFRSFLLGSLKYFVDHAEERKQAQKRGGKIKFVSWDAHTAPSQVWFPAQESLAPEQLFDLRWATTIVERALYRLREECEHHGRRRLFEGLSVHLATDRGDIHYSELAMALGVAETVVKKQLHNLRQRYRSLLRDEVAQTVGDANDVEDEIRHLCAVLGRERFE